MADVEILLVRHGQSLANTGAVDPQQRGDHSIGLTARGRQQAEARGREIGADFLRNSLIYCSPYRRTRETLEQILAGAQVNVEDDGLRIYEDPRLREVEHGFEGSADEVEAQTRLRKIHGWFYYRFRGGESPADCYDRVCTFLESMIRQLERKGLQRVIVVTHGLTLRCFVMRFLHLTVEQFEVLANPDNADLTRIAEASRLENPVYVRGRWGVEGLKLRPSPMDPEGSG